ncbi:YicC/YloC family endoribonuclease [Pontiella agarivorans]|uniref:YicC family protein n=1 Tax=Pontiella agarivorans TaxID=3038953 RepID=A0ABU5MVW3_9BACT|nr:YicC/YloC family endoribonuclease [Pontiella agarivorans]MDZ8118347.1 YicC family protein [Pontiella agarivorans]
MALKSMTGFGEGAAAASGIRVSVELSSVNRKQLDINVNLPRNLVTLDAQVQRTIREQFSRGRVSGIIRVEAADGSAGSVTVDEKLAAEYVAGIRKAAAKLNLNEDLGAELISRLPGVVSIEQQDLDSDQVSDVLAQALGKALKGLAKMRAAEGKALETDLRERLALLDEYTKNIRKLAPTVVITYREKLFQRLEEAGLTDLASDERIVKEIALFADRCDISEELTRLKSHLAQARKLLRSKEPVGRTLDFLCQELFREINTTGSKANEVEITRQVVAFKTELERIREQVQNIE